MSVGQSLPHDSAVLHVTGRARYVDDQPVPQGTLHLAFGLSTIAHGEITSIDLSAVKSAPGVVLVMTAKDLPFANDVSPSAHDEPMLATGSVHYVGQPIFLVVAESHLAARKAAWKPNVVASQTPWQEIQRGIVDELAQGMVLKPAVKYQRIHARHGVPRDNH